MKKRQSTIGILFLLIVCMIPSQASAKVNHGFKEISRQKYGQDCMHTYQHIASGLEVVWIENKDVNKAFVIGVKTPTTNNTGVNHIIEHTLFTGSEAYPSASLYFDANEAYPSTYMNALTSGDMTIFPFATPYEPCYWELMHIYLDAVFKPQLLTQPYGFYEEGFHLVPQEERCGGVVYNEMKGAYASVERAVYRQLRKAIFTDTHYAYDSGGDPNEIPKLTYEDFVTTYKNYYYPGNMKMIVYGKVNIQKALAQIATYVQGVKTPQAGIDLSVDKLSEVTEATYSSLPTQNSGCLVKAFVLEKPLTTQELQSLELWMSTYLMGSESYLQTALGATGLHGKWLKDDDVPYPVYALVITDVPCDKMDIYEKKLDEMLEKAPHMIQTNILLEQHIINQSRWFITNQDKSNNRGIQISMGVLDGWAHQRDEAQYYIRKEQIQHLTAMDATIGQKLLKEAKRYTYHFLPATQSILPPEQLTPVDTETWIKNYEQMKTWQSQKVTLKPLDLEGLVVKPIKAPQINKLQDYWTMETKVDTTLARSEIYVNTSHIPQDKLPYLFLYSYLLEESAGDITPFSGNIQSSCTAYPLKEGYWPCFRLSIVTPLEEINHGVLFNEARSYLMNKPDAWYRQKLIELTMGMRANSQSNAIGTMAQLCTGIEGERGAYLYEKTYPLYRFCKQLLGVHHQQWINQIKQMDDLLYHKGGLIVATTLPKQSKNPYLASWDKIIEEWEIQPNYKGDYQVEVPLGNYVVKSDMTIDHSYKSLYKAEGIDGVDYLFAAYLTKNYLNPELRVKHGAYGAACQIYDLQTIGMYSYRTPDYHHAVEIINKSINYLSQPIDPQSLNYSKAEALSRVHSQYRLLGTPIEQSSALEQVILWGRSPKTILFLQKEILEATPEQLASKKKVYEKLMLESKTAVMTRKCYTDEQNFTIYRY